MGSSILVGENRACGSKTTSNTNLTRCNQSRKYILYGLLPDYRNHRSQHVSEVSSPRHFRLSTRIKPNCLRSWAQFLIIDRQVQIW